MAMNPCAIFTVPKPPRGGKGFDARYEAYAAEIARIASTCCGASKNESVALTMGRYTVARIGRGEAELFAASCRMPESIGAPQRYVASRAEATNTCSTSPW